MKILKKQASIKKKATAAGSMKCKKNSSCLRWIVQHDNLLTVQATKNHAGEDMDIFDFVLTQDEMSTLDNLQTKQKKPRLNSPTSLST